MSRLLRVVAARRARQEPLELLPVATDKGANAGLKVAPIGEMLAGAGSIDDLAVL